jgi:hypothetical protein
VQAILAGTAAMLPAALWRDDTTLDALGWLLGGAALVHLLFVLGEVSLPHVTAHATLAAHAMTAGRYRGFFWAGIGLVAPALLAVTGVGWLAVATAVVALAGLALHEHAYVQAGQSVPLA